MIVNPTSNITQENIQEKMLVLITTLVMIGAISLVIQAESMIVFLLLPFMFDAGHFSLSIYYQFKTKQFNLFYIFKIFMALIFCGTLIYWGNPTFNRWIVYAFGSWHILHGEKYTLKSKFTFSEWDILLPVGMYSYLTYLKYFNIKIYQPLVFIFASLVVLNAIWVYLRNRLTLSGSFYLYFCILNFVALLFHEKIPLLFIVTFYIYFHYISWYIYTAKKSLNLKKYIAIALAVNVSFIASILMLIFIPFGENVAQYLHDSFFVTGWLIFHLVLTIRPFGLFVKTYH